MSINLPTILQKKPRHFFQRDGSHSRLNNRLALYRNLIDLISSRIHTSPSTGHTSTLRRCFAWPHVASHRRGLPHLTDLASVTYTILHNFQMANSQRLMVKIRASQSQISSYLWRGT